MKIVILSGGSGNNALVCGLKKLYKDCDIKVIVNAYDNGKSTGFCRKVTNTLGVSDIRKNHIRMYKATKKNINQNYIEFYENRYDFFHINFVHEKLCNWGLSDLWPFAYDFLNKCHDLDFHDFNIANIVYSEMYEKLGYEYTNNYFCNLLGIDDFVVLNSFDNVFINAITSDYSVLYDEGDIVEYSNADYPIQSIFYSGDVQNGLNKKAIDLLHEANLILISTGTFWSSIYPTLQYGDFYKVINNSKAKKIWAINTIEDKDAIGVSSSDFIRHVLNLGLDLSDFTVLENLDAVDILKEDFDGINIVKKSMKNINGKHDMDLFAREVFNIYYGIEDIVKSNYNYIFDFDDTIWSRDENDIEYSIENVKLLSKFNNAIIISGNSFNSIRNKLSSVFGSSLESFNIPIWADANSIEYKNGDRVDYLKSLDIHDSVEKLFYYLRDTYDINIPLLNMNQFYLKLKPLGDLERKVLCDYLNNYLFKQLGIDDCVAHITGKSTIDILHKNNNKMEVFNYLNLDAFSNLYIGDEIDKGNDQEIANSCKKYIRTSGAVETNLLLKLLLSW